MLRGLPPECTISSLPCAVNWTQRVNSPVPARSKAGSDGPGRTLLPVVTVVRAWAHECVVHNVCVTRRGWFLFLTMSLLWGVPYLFIKVALGELSPAVVVFARLALGALVLIPWALLTGAFAGLRVQWRSVVALGALIAGAFAMITIGERHITSSLTGLLIAAEPLLLAVLAWRFAADERVTGVRLVGLLVGFTGVLVLLGVDLAGDASAVLGAGLVLLAAVGYAVVALINSGPLRDTSPLGGVAAALGVAALLTAPWAAMNAPAHRPHPAVIGSVIALGVLCTAVAFVAFFSLIRLVGAAPASVITYVNPAVAVTLGVLILGEPLTAATVAGFLLILAGSWLSTGGTLPPRLAVSRSIPRRHLRGVGRPRPGGAGSSTQHATTMPTDLAMPATIFSAASRSSRLPSKAS